MEKELKNLLKRLKLSESTISTALGALVVIIVGILIFNYFKQTPSQEEEITPEAAQEEAEIIFEENETGEKVPNNLPATHKVTSSENLWKIAEKYYTSGYNWVDIARENELSNANIVVVGQELIIPKVAVRKPLAEVKKVAGAAITEETYKVQKGDNLWEICVRAYGDGYKWIDVAKVNNLANPNLILVDQELKLPR